MSEKLQFERKPGSRFKRFLTATVTGASLLAYYAYTHNAAHLSKNFEALPPNPYANVESLAPSSQANKSHYIYTDAEFRNASLKKYQGTVQIPTEVYDFTSRPEEELNGWEPFLQLHEFFEKTFPLVHKHLKVEKINKLGLVITYEGSNPDLGPLVFAAHQDVVPVDEETLDSWTYDPYSAYYDGEYVWGRGSADTKNLLVAILETFEELLKDGFKPKRTLILASGYDEEAIGRYDGAVSISKFLEDRYGAKNIYALVDEGGSVSKYHGSWIATPQIAEKGYLDIYIKLKVPGGHSSVPPDHTAIGIIGDLTHSLEANPYKSEIVDYNPLLNLLRTIGETSTELDEQTKHDFIFARYDQAARERVIEKLSSENGFKYLFRTSQAIDIVNAGVKINALPEVLTLGINHRIAHGVTSQDVINRVIDHVSRAADAHGLGVSLQNGTVITENTPEGSFEISWVQPLDPSPISKTEGKTWDVFAGTIKHTFEDVILNEPIAFGPSVVGGYTDASRYWPLTDHVYRFIGAAGTHGTNAHAINEHLEFDLHLQAIAFLYDYILNVDEYDS